MHNFVTPVGNPDKVAIITIGDDDGSEQGDYETIHKMHRAFMTDNTLFKILEVKNTIYHVKTEQAYYYHYLVYTENVEYLCEFLDLVNKKSKLDKALYEFNQKNSMTKKRKFE